MDNFENNAMPPLSLDDAYEWMFEPTFAFASLLQTAVLPAEANEDDATLWSKIIFQDGHPFISQGNWSVSQQSIEARKRHCSLSPLYGKFPKHLPFVLLMAEVHFLLNDLHGALDLFQEALALHLASDEPRDEILVRSVAMLEIITKDLEQAYEPDDPSVEVFVYSRPADWRSYPLNQPELDVIHERWGALKKKQGGTEEFARFAAVKSNELEGVFLLEGSSGEQLARCGLLANCIQGISPKSHIQNPDQIISILDNAQEAYKKLVHAAKGDDGHPFGDAFLKEQHAQLLQGANISVEIDNDSGELVASLVPGGKYRRVPCIAQHHRDNAETQFCLPGDMKRELQWFFAQASMVLSDSSADPYSACAWLQHAFLKIHPFGDGNGRVGRMISSIPLLKAGLPPVFVSVENKFEYFDALIAADDSQDISTLACFLRRETLDALDKLLLYVASPMGSVTPKAPAGTEQNDTNTDE